MVRNIFDELEKAMHDPNQRERREQCWAKTKKEIEAGLVSPPTTKRRMDRKYGRGKWRCVGRNAILQKGKWRCIDNAKRNKGNKASTLHERITCGRADFPVTMTREFARRAPEKLKGAISKRAKQLRMQHGTMDLKAAYRHVPTSQPQFTNVAVIDTDKQQVVVCELPGLNFGFASAVVKSLRSLPRAASCGRYQSTTTTTQTRLSRHLDTPKLAKSTQGRQIQASATYREQDPSRGQNYVDGQPYD